MAEGRLDEKWEHTAWISATYVNVNRPKGAKAIAPDAMNPRRSMRPKSLNPQLRKIIARKGIKPLTPEQIEESRRFCGKPK